CFPRAERPRRAARRWTPTRAPAAAKRPHPLHRRSRRGRRRRFPRLLPASLGRVKLLRGSRGRAWALALAKAEWGSVRVWATRLSPACPGWDRRARATARPATARLVTARLVTAPRVLVALATVRPATVHPGTAPRVLV